MEPITISMPLSFMVGKKKLSVNMNVTRNLHFQVMNKLKVKYKTHALPYLKGLYFPNKISLTFILWKRDNRRVDRENPLSMHSKFFCDAMVSAGCIKDDNDSFIESSHFYTGGVDKLNPRVDIIISDARTLDSLLLQSH